MRRFWVKSQAGAPYPRVRRVYRLRRTERQSAALHHCPHHIMQRRPDGKLLFDTPRDYRAYLLVLRTLREKLALKVYRFSLMGNHAHLVADGRPERLTQLMRCLCDLGAPHLKRPLPAWQKCVHFVPIQSSAYWDNCTRYVELNPLRAGLCARPQDYLWSSHACEWLDPDPCPTDLLQLDRDGKDADW
jgi:putative transposase